MRKIFLIITFFKVLYINAQTNYGKGYDKGWKEGYCHNERGVCVSPITPIAPIPRIGENSNNYVDGYNRGFADGLEAYQKNTKKSNNDIERFTTAEYKPTTDFLYNHPYQLEFKVVSDLINRAKYFLENEDYDNALNIGNDIIELKPEIAVGYTTKGIAYYKKGDILNAYNYIRKSLNKGSDNVDFYKNLHGKLEEEVIKLMKEEKYSSVQYICENIWDRTVGFEYILGLSYFYQGNYEKSKKHLKKVKKYYPVDEYLDYIKNNKK